MNIDYKALLLQFIGSLTLCDHMGDVSNDVQTVLKRMNMPLEFDDWDDLGEALSKIDVTTLMGTKLKED